MSYTNVTSFGILMCRFVFITFFAVVVKRKHCVKIRGRQLILETLLT